MSTHPSCTHADALREQWDAHADEHDSIAKGFREQEISAEDAVVKFAALATKCLGTIEKAVETVGDIEIALHEAQRPQFPTIGAEKGGAA